MPEHMRRGRKKYRSLVKQSRPNLLRQVSYDVTLNEGSLLLMHETHQLRCYLSTYCQ